MMDESFQAEEPRCPASAPAPSHWRVNISRHQYPVSGHAVFRTASRALACSQRVRSARAEHEMPHLQAAPAQGVPLQRTPRQCFGRDPPKPSRNTHDCNSRDCHGDIHPFPPSWVRRLTRPTIWGIQVEGPSDSALSVRLVRFQQTNSQQTRCEKTPRHRHAARRALERCRTLWVLLNGTSHFLCHEQARTEDHIPVGVPDVARATIFFLRGERRPDDAARQLSLRPDESTGGLVFDQARSASKIWKRGRILS